MASSARVLDFGWRITPALFLGLCLILGGASISGLPQNAALQIIALAVLVGAAFRGGPIALDPPVRRVAISLISATAALILLQLVPLPPAFWTALPGRAFVAETLRLVGLVPGWQPLTLTPNATLAAGLKFLPPIALFTALVLQADTRAATLSLWTILAVALVSILLGVAQLGQQHPELYFYTITNAQAAVGFYANTNHLATLLLVAMAAAAGGSTVGAGGGAASFARGLHLFVLAAMALGIFMVGSRAGIALMVPVLTGCALIAFGIRLPIRPSPIATAITLSALLAVAAGFYWVFVTQAHDTLPGPYTREMLFENTLKLAGTYFPFGSGLGSFQGSYRLTEAADAATLFYVNHAHNDLVELAADTGLAGLAILLLFLFGWTQRAIAIWSAKGRAYALARAGSVGSAAMLLHSLVEYPLRTAAGACLFALCCALMFQTATTPRAEDEDVRFRDFMRRSPSEAP